VAAILVAGAGVPESVRQVLRDATREAHRRVDACFGRFDLACPRGYRDFLVAHSAVLPGCEASLEASGAAALIADWPRRCRAAALLDDLARVGAARSTRPTTLRRLSPAELFGIAYVLEGSRMGGAVLARQVEANTDPDCRAATRYLRHGAGQGLWPSFLAALEASDPVRADPDAAVAAASATFAAFAEAAG
jgi:heme oxygenase